MLRKSLVLLLTIISLAGAVQALSISNLNFGDVDQGAKYTQALVLMNSPQDIDNHFVIELGGTMKDWLAVSPSEFDLASGSSQSLTVTLSVPVDAPLGDKTGTITAVGKKTVPSTGGPSGGAAVGYSVATKSNVVANVVKPGATAAIEITGVETPKAIRPGDIVKLTISARNAGNVPAAGQFSVAVERGADPVATIPGVPVDFGLDTEQTVKIYWDTQGQPEGTYTAVVSVVPSSSGKDVKIRTASYPPITLEISGQGTPPFPDLLLPIIAGICVVVGIVLPIFILKNRKRP